MAGELWAYQMIDFRPGFFGLKYSQRLQAELNRLGRQGWELVIVAQGMPTRLVLKRQEAPR
jgi:hypothetical protein